MFDRTIDSVLQALRRRIIRDGLEGLPHVEALLTMRGVRLTKVPPPMPPDCKHHRAVMPVVLASLQGGGKTIGQVGDSIMAARPGMDRKRAMIRGYRMLYKLRNKGAVRNDGGLWGLVVTPPSASSPSTCG